MNNLLTDIQPKSFESHIIQNKKNILSLSTDEKLKHINTLTITYPKMKKILNLIDECHTSSRFSTGPKCMRICGETGSGKTTIVKTYSKKYPIRETENGTERPILYTRIPCPAYIGGLAHQILRDLGDPFHLKSRKIIINTHRLYDLLKACKVEIIFVDEVQHLVDRNSQKLLRDSSDWFKDLIDNTNIPIVFLCIPDSNKIFLENKQLLNRVRINEHIDNFSYDDTFKTVLYLFDLSLPLEKSSNFASSDISKRIYIATEGLMKHIRDLIIESTTIALSNNAAKVTLPMLATAYNKILYDISERNPFMPDYKL